MGAEKLKKTISVKPCKKVETKHVDGSSNGWVLEIVSERDGFTKNLKGQMYLTVANVGSVKGYHVHAIATYHVTCIKGRVKSTMYIDRENKTEMEMGDGDFKTIKYPPGSANLFANIGQEPAYILIYRDIPWDPDVHEQLDILPEDIEKEETWDKINKFVAQFK